MREEGKFLLRVLLTEHLLEITASWKIEAAPASALSPACSGAHGNAAAGSVQENLGCSSLWPGFCLPCHAAVNPELLHRNRGNYSRFMPVSMKRGFLLNGSGQPLARWKGKKWLSVRQLLLSAGFCQVRSHRFFFVGFLFSFFLPPLRLISFFYFPEWVAALCTLQGRGTDSQWRKGCPGDRPGPSFWVLGSPLLEAVLPCSQWAQYWLLLLSPRDSISAELASSFCCAALCLQCQQWFLRAGAKRGVAWRVTPGGASPGNCEVLPCRMHCGAPAGTSSYDSALTFPYWLTSLLAQMHAARWDLRAVWLGTPAMACICTWQRGKGRERRKMVVRF